MLFYLQYSDNLPFLSHHAMEKYSSYENLSKTEVVGKDYRIRTRHGNSGILLMAPHGGGIEPGTTEIAEAIAGKYHSFYTFSGIKPNGNADLHITSRNFNEPEGVHMAQTSYAVVTIHGCRETGKITFMGGRDKDLVQKITFELIKAGFNTKTSRRFPGINARNICNRSPRGMGAQLELSTGLRQDMFEEITRIHRKKTTPAFHCFVRGVQAALAGYVPSDQQRQPELSQIESITTGHLPDPGSDG
jgi:phage replication-related protein YjqB (UPF0714/DUF867 family)